ncbi:polyprenyl synthetase family protein [Floricoccus penangensis]|uniref:polyprenyl synthetase family protein n=1 Tax=Floricoccus penangensis TaxID=1859475 RepID=UPI00203F5AA8|nr:farnesyl diphosphate synthase [Floricoccus penangensis]URZ88229.1 polyprenyl synthetase family protein [Floricoccus penangensis]
MENDELLSNIDETIREFYSAKEMIPHLTDSILYSVNAGGKRIRPLFMLQTLRAFGIELTEEHYKVATSVELIHTSSLIHDDLPAMDNDDYRRGRLTNHKVYGYAQAILAGDALLLDPYNLLVSSELPAEILVKLVRELSYASGSYGMVAGQVLDMDSEQKEISLDELKQIHALKTGRMLTFPFVAAAIVAQADERIVEKLRKLGEHIGLAFQIRDDIKDVTADFAEIGKTPGKDIEEDKATYVKFLGLEGAKEALENELYSARQIIKELSDENDFWPSSVLELINMLDINDK